MKRTVAILLLFLAAVPAAQGQKKKVKFMTPEVVPDTADEKGVLRLLPPIIPSGDFAVVMRSKGVSKKVKVQYTLHGNNNTVFFFDSLVVSLKQAQNAITEIAVTNWREQPLMKCDNIKQGNSCFFDLSRLEVNSYKICFYNQKGEAENVIEFQKNYPTLGSDR